jgi:CRP/FNR family transcriptional regulator, anaerobic regulatory protein
MDEFQQLLKQFRVKRFKKGEIILVQGEVPECAYIVKSGIVKSYNLTLSGEEKPIGFDMEGDLFPIAWIYKKLKHVQFYYEAFTEIEVHCVPTQEIRHFLDANPAIQAYTMDKLIDRYVNMQLRVNALEQSKASLKVLNTIHFLCLRFGQDVKKNVVKIQLPLTQQDLANFIGLTRETTGIELKKLQDATVLSRKKQYMVVRTDKLNELLDEDYGLGIVLDSVVASKNTSVD